MRKILLSLSIMFLLVFTLVSCTSTSSDTNQVSSEVMKVAKYYWPGMYWVEIADQKGWFDEAGLNMELIDANSDYYQSLDDTISGLIDSNNFYLYDLIDYQLSNSGLVAVINSDTSHGSEALIAKNKITTISELKGKKIGITRGTNLEYELSIVLSKNNLKLQDVILVDAPAEQLADIFINGDVDAILTWQPVANTAQELGGGHKLFDTSEISGISPIVFAFKKDFIDQRPADVQAYVNVWHKTTEYIKENSDEAFQIIADIYNVSFEEVAAFTQDDKILDLEDNKIAFSYAAGFESLHGTARQINDFMIENAITDEQLDSTDFIDARFIRNVQE